MSRALLLPTALALAASCGGDPSPRAAKAPGAPVAPAVAPDPPAAWALRYRRANMVVVRLDGGKRLEVGEHGERWLVTPHGRERASTFFPSPIAAGVVASDGEIAFATSDGTIFPVASANPLGPIGAPRKPPRELVQLVIGKRAILARAGRDVVRSIDAGRTWAPVDIGGAPRSLRAIALARDGTGALLQIPQRTLVTDDDGATWTHVPPPPHGVSGLEIDDDGGLVLAVTSRGERTMQVAASPPRWIPRRPDSSSTSTDAAAALEPFADRSNIVRARGGQAFAWTQVKTDAFLVKLDKIEDEPTSVIGVDVARLLATKPLPVCTAASRGELRIPFTFDPPSGLTILLAHKQRPPTFAASEVVVRATPDGKACLSALVAVSSDHQHGMMLDLADPSHAMTWTNGRTLPSFLESASCRAEVTRLSTADL